VVQITLSFPSVAQALAALSKLDVPSPQLSFPEIELVEAPAPKPSRAAKSASPAPVAEPVAAPAPVTAPPAEAPAPVAAPAPAAAEPAPVQYADLQKAVLQLYKLDRAKTQQIAIDMGFESFKVMPADRWAEALAAVNGALGV